MSRRGAAVPTAGRKTHRWNAERVGSADDGGLNLALLRRRRVRVGRTGRRAVNVGPGDRLRLRGPAETLRNGVDQDLIIKRIVNFVVDEEKEV